MVSLSTLVLGEFRSASGSKPDKQEFYERTFWFGQWGNISKPKATKVIGSCFLEGTWFILISSKGMGKATSKDIEPVLSEGNRLMDLVWPAELIFYATAIILIRSLFRFIPFSSPKSSTDLFPHLLLQCNLLGFLYRQVMVCTPGSFQGHRNVALCSTQDWSSAAFFAKLFSSP